MSSEPLTVSPSIWQFVIELGVVLTEMEETMKRNDQDKTLAGDEVDEDPSYLVRVGQKIWIVIGIRIRVALIWCQAICFQLPRGITFEPLLRN